MTSEGFQNRASFGEFVESRHHLVSIWHKWYMLWVCANARVHRGQSSLLPPVLPRVRVGVQRVCSHWIPSGLGWLARELSGSFCVCLKAGVIRLSIVTPCILHGCWELNSGPSSHSPNHQPRNNNYFLKFWNLSFVLLI